MTIEEDIEQARSDVELLQQELYEAEDRLRALLDAAAPFKVGDEVEARSGKEWKPAVVARLRHWTGWTDFYVYFLKKDGTPSFRPQLVGENIRKRPS